MNAVTLSLDYHNEVYTSFQYKKIKRHKKNKATIRIPCSIVLSNTSREGRGNTDIFSPNLTGFLSVHPPSSPKKGAQIPIVIQ